MKTSIFKKAEAALLALSLCTLTACSTAASLNDTTSTRESTTTLSALTEGSLTTPPYYTPEPIEPNDIYTPENQLSLLADRDFDGSYFLIVQEEGLENAIFPTSDELLSIYSDRRNRLVQEKYNVHLASRVMSENALVKELSEAIENGNYFCDLLIVSPDLLERLQNEDLLLALDTLPFFETDSICINSQATAELNCDRSGIYGIWGDVLRQPTRQFCVYFNESLAESLGFPNFYADVRAGDWTIEDFLAAAEVAGEREGVNGILYNGSISDLLFSASGLSSTSVEGGELTSDPTYQSYLYRFSSLTNGASVDPLKDFLAGETLFYVGTLGDYSSFALTDEVFGVLPMPKYNATDEDYPGITDQSVLPVLACPKNVATLEGSGIMLSALNAASCDEINEMYLQSAEQYVRTNGSYLMLPYLIGDIRFDRKLIFG